MNELSSDQKKENATEWYQEYKISFSKATGKICIGRG